MDREFEDMDSAGRWQNLYMEIRNQSYDSSYKVAKYPENRNRNRYRDVSPFDHSRVKLQNTENDYINASLVLVEEAQRSYILTQGPLRNTCGHFWLMIWEQKSRAVIMLNRVIEKGSEKCAQYWPTKDDQEMYFSDTGFHLKLISEDVKSYFTVRELQLEDIKMDKRKDPSSVDIKKILLDMRKYRMGLIQTPDQLRFSYLAVIEGAKYIMGDSSVQERWKELSNEDQKPSSPTQNIKHCTENCNGARISPLIKEEHAIETKIPEVAVKQECTDGNTASSIRKRKREDRIAGTAQKVQEMKQKLSKAEIKRKRWIYWKPILINVGAIGVLVFGAYVCWRLYVR
ncbi:PTN1 phosphatase, partial [Polypterus senegalus]